MQNDSMIIINCIWLSDYTLNRLVWDVFIFASIIIVYGIILCHGFAYRTYPSSPLALTFVLMVNSRLGVSGCTFGDMKKSP